MFCCTPFHQNQGEDASQAFVVIVDPYSLDEAFAAYVKGSV